MAISTAQISGLATGFDWRSMIDELIAVERGRVDIVETEKAEYEVQLSEWQSFNSNLLALKTAIEKLKDRDDFNQFTASMASNSQDVSAYDLLSVSTSEEAARGSYSIQITNLATSQKLSSNPFTSQTEELGSSYAGDIIINGKAVTISATDTLAYVADLINNANSGTNPTGVTASIINYGANDYRLILTSDETGADGISLVNGSASDLVQKFGWKDNQSTVVKNSITGGAQSDRFAAPNLTVQTMLGLSAGEASSGSLTIGGTAVTIDLAAMSLNDIKDAINNAAISGVTAAVISEDVDGDTYYRIQIDGTQTFVDENNILNSLGILDHTSIDVSGLVSANNLTSDGATLATTTLLNEIDGYNTFTTGGYSAGDYITLTGTNTSGSDIGTINFDISSTTTIQDLLDEIESHYGDVVAYVTSDGTIQVDDLTGGASLTVSLAATLQDANSQLDFGAFGAAAARKREIIAGSDAVVEIDGVTVTKSSNMIDDVISGVTLNLTAESAATTITLDIDRDLETIESNIKSFVDSYNQVMSYVNAQFTFDAESEETGGILFGDATLRSVKSDLTALLTETIWGLDDDFSSLGLIGIENKVNDDSQLELTIDENLLSNYLQSNFNDVVSLFVGQGTASTSSVAYVGHSRDTQAGEYIVHIDRAATRGEDTGYSDLSAGGVDETLTITQGDDVAEITITSDLSLGDIVNEINAELDSAYVQTIVGDAQLYADATQTSAITAETTWDSIYTDLGTQLTFANYDTITIAGAARDGSEINGTYDISDTTTDTVQDLLSAIEDAFASKVTASIDSSGRIMVMDEFDGYSQLALSSLSHDGEGEFFGSVDITDGADDGSQTGRYAMAITAEDDGNGHLVLRSDVYGDTSFDISQDTSDGNYDHIIFSQTGNTTASSNNNVAVEAATTWADVYGADVANNDTITISGFARDGSTAISDTYTVTDTTTDTLDGLLIAIENAYSAQGTTVDAFLREGQIYIEDTTAGASAIALTLTANNEGGGSLDLGTHDQTTQRDLDLGMVNGTVTGLDVAGTIDGENATGTGQYLRGDTGNTNTDGLGISYTGTSNNIDAGNITVTLGVAELFDRSLFNITDSFDGYVAFKQNSLQNTINRLDDNIDTLNARLDLKMERMISRFVAMELTMSQLQNQSNWLSGQISALFSNWG